MTDIEVYDNREKTPEYWPEPVLLGGRLVEMSTWPGAENVLLVLDKGYTVSISKTALRRILDWAEAAEVLKPVTGTSSIQ